MSKLILPHGGTLNNLMLGGDALLQAQINALKYPSHTLNKRQLCDIELILNGGFSPLNGFMMQHDYESVINNLTLANGMVWPMPITLDVSEKVARSISSDNRLALRDTEGFLIAILQVENIWEPDKQTEAAAVYGQLDETHPGIQYLLRQTERFYLGGRIEGIQLPRHYDYVDIRLTPAALRNHFNTMGWSQVVGFQTRNPMHRAHQELTIQAASENNANLLIHPVVGMTKPGDINHFTRVKCYKILLKQYPPKTTYLSLLPLAMRMAGPREALWHALIRKNYGCTHFIVGRDHAGPGKNNLGKDFYGPYDAQELVKKYESKIEIKMVPFQEMVYVKNKAAYLPMNQIQPNDTVLKISGTEFRRKLDEGEEIPPWFSYPDIIHILRSSNPPKPMRGFTLFFTGLSGAGKSTLANAVMIRLLEIDERPVTLLDGDIVRQNLSSELTFSKAHRDLNIQRIGFVAAQITKSRGIAICAQIAPYRLVRDQVRAEISQYGGFFEIYVSTSLTTCEKRDPKRLYAKARAGELKGFTGIDDPYEAPLNAELVIDTSNISVEESVVLIVKKLEQLGYIKSFREEKGAERPHAQKSFELA